MGRPKKSQPSYLLHKPSGQARVRIDGVDHYLGEHGSPESWEAYHRLLLEKQVGPTAGISPPRKKPASGRVTIGELVKAYKEFATGYYGEKSAELYPISSAVHPLEAYASLPVDEFSPLKLKAVQEKIVQRGDCRASVIKKFGPGGKQLSRKTANEYLHILKRMFKWGVSEEYVPASVYQALLTVAPIKKGRGKIATLVADSKKVLRQRGDDQGDAETAFSRIGDDGSSAVALRNASR
jgi:hypothetical protein